MSFTWGSRAWAPGDQQAFVQWLRKHGSNYGSWSANHANAAASFVTPNQASAIAQATALTAPQIAAIDAAQKKANTDSQALLKNNQGFTTALAGILAGIGPMVSGNYGNASGEVAGLAKGFGDSADAQAASQQAGLDATLAKTGAPQAAVDQANAKVGGPVGDVLYGSEGFIPASTMAREGAAFTSAADQLPAYAGGMGQQNAHSILKDLADQVTQFNDQRAQARLTIPGTANEILQQREANRLQQESIDTSANYLSNAQRNTDARLTHIDPATGLPVYDPHTQQVNWPASKIAGHQVDGNGRDIYDTNGQLIPVDTGAGAKATKTHNAAVHAKNQAFDQAHQSMFSDVKGLYKTVPPDPTVFGSVATHVPPDYVTASKYLFAKYKTLLRYSSRAGRPRLKAQLNAMIRDVLAANHIYPPAGAPRPRTSSTSGADTPGPHNAP